MAAYLRFSGDREGIEEEVFFQIGVILEALICRIWWHDEGAESIASYVQAMQSLPDFVVSVWVTKLTRDDSMVYCENCSVAKPSRLLGSKVGMRGMAFPLNLPVFPNWTCASSCEPVTNVEPVEPLLDLRPLDRFPFVMEVNVFVDKIIG